MTGYLELLTAYYDQVGKDYVVLGDAVWIEYQRMVVPIGPVCRDYRITPDEEERLLSHFRRAVLIRYTDGFQPGPEDSPWYAVTCHKFVDLSECSSKLRSHIRRGLRRCIVRQVDAEYMVKHGYDVYAAAFARYKNVKGPELSRSAWEHLTRGNKDYPDLRHYWVVSIDNQLAGYVRTINFDKTEVTYSVSKYDPKYLGDYSSYAMQYTMNEYYLRQRSIDYINVGFRTISHETNIQEFRIKNFGFERTPTNLYVRYRPLVSAALSLPRFAKRWLQKLSPQYASLCTMDDARNRGETQSRST